MVAPHLSKHGLVNKASSAQARRTDCPFIDRLPTEIRLKIFGIVLQAHSSVTQDQFWQTRGNVNTALFTVCRQISIEAQDAFYEVNTTRVEDRWDGYEKRLLTRHPELGENVVRWITQWPGRNGRIALDAFAQLSKLKNVSIGKRARIAGSCVRDGKVERGEYMDRFIDFGVIEIALPPPHTGKAFLKDFKFVHMLREARQILAQKTLEEIHALHQSFFTERDRRGVRRLQPGVGRLELEATGAALCLKAFDLWRSRESGTEVGKLEKSLVREHIEEGLQNSFCFDEDVHAPMGQMLADTRLMGLNVQEHGGHLLRLASNVMKYHLVS